MKEIHALFRMSWEAAYDDVELAIAEAEREVLEAQESGDLVRIAYAKMRRTDCWILRSNTWILKGAGDAVDIGKELDDEDLLHRGYVTVIMLQMKRGTHGHRTACLTGDISKCWVRRS